MKAELKPSGPNEFQSKIQELNVEEFVLKTNIREIIRNDMKDSTANISDDEFTKRLLQYNAKRHNIHQWNRSGLKNLKFDDTHSERNATIPLQSRAKTTKSALNENTNVKKSSHNEAANILDNSRVKQTSASIEPNDFQRQIMAMDYEAFINETNAKDLVRKHFETEMKPLTDEIMGIELKKLDELRYQFRRYHKGLLNHLKILKCECQRNKKFDDKCTQTDAIPSQDADVQCNSVESGSHECDTAGQNENLSQTKLSKLTVHEISESEIIQITSVSSTGPAGKTKRYIYQSKIGCYINLKIIAIYQQILQRRVYRKQMHRMIRLQWLMRQNLIFLILVSKSFCQALKALTTFQQVFRLE